MIQCAKRNSPGRSFTSGLRTMVVEPYLGTIAQVGSLVNPLSMAGVIERHTV